MIKKILIGFSLLALTACAGMMLPHLTPAQTAWAAREWPGISEKEISNDRATYVTHCSGCHNVVQPSRHSMDEWQVMVSSMAARARITRDQRASILRYLAAAKSAP